MTTGLSERELAEDGWTDLTVAHIKAGEEHKGGWVTPCDAWVDRHTILRHALLCPGCRDDAAFHEAK